ncbi:MAG TPA: efflux RND transporter periplasmic adaptor subunit [Bryobacteraceae bacterium]|nr:efflux RND transporter periplasmic adaptor subunit [Bryobacteraceae bacterium]
MNQTNINNEEQLRSEIEDLKRQLAASQAALQRKAPSSGTAVAVVVLLLALALAGYYLGYLPRQKRELALAAESKTDTEALPVVTVTPVTRSGLTSSLVLPGNIQAVTEAPVLARASGYIKSRAVDIGDHVKQGQVLAEIEAPELDQQIRQAQASIDQAGSTMEQSQAALEQGQSNEALARITAERSQKLFDRNVISRQDNDTAQMQYAAQRANVAALTKAVAAAKSSESALRANLARLNELHGYLAVCAPFAGVITMRNIDVGALVNEGSTLLYRIAQTNRLRTYLNVPQADSGSVRTGQRATLVVSDLGGRKFTGQVTRTANALDPASRTLLTEVQVDNSSGALLPGMYSEVDLAVPRAAPPLIIPADTLVVRGSGPQVAVVDTSGVVHYTLIHLGRDFGDHLEVLDGLEAGQLLAVNPGDTIREGARVKPQVESKR